MELTKTETELNMKSLRFLLLTIIVVSVLVGCLMIVLGLSIYTTYHSFTFFYESAKNGVVFTPSVLCVLLGLATLIISSFGFFGSIKKSTCMVNMYALLLSVTLIMKLVIVIITFTLDANTVMNYVYIPLKYYVTDPEITAEVDALQRALNCCGSESYLDYLEIDLTSMNHSTVYAVSEIEGDMLTMTLPGSCCINDINRLCVRLRTNSCKGALVNVVVQNATVLAVLGVSVLFIKALGVIFALLLARCIRKLKSERALMEWRIKEQTILARQEQENEKNPFYNVSIGHNDSSTA